MKIPCMKCIDDERTLMREDNLDHSSLHEALITAKSGALKRVNPLMHIKNSSSIKNALAAFIETNGVLASLLEPYPWCNIATLTERHRNSQRFFDSIPSASDEAEAPRAIIRLQHSGGNATHGWPAGPSSSSWSSQDREEANKKRKKQQQQQQQRQRQRRGAKVFRGASCNSGFSHLTLGPSRLFEKTPMSPSDSLDEIALQIPSAPLLTVANHITEATATVSGWKATISHHHHHHRHRHPLMGVSINVTPGYDRRNRATLPCNRSQCQQHQQQDHHHNPSSVSATPRDETPSRTSEFMFKINYIFPNNIDFPGGPRRMPRLCFSSSLRIRIANLFFKLLTCVLYIFRVVTDLNPTYATCYGCKVGNKSEFILSAERTEEAFQENPIINWDAILWVNRPNELWAVQLVLALISLTEALLMAYLGYKGNIWQQILSFHFILELVTTIPFAVTIVWPPFRNLFIPVFLNCWLAKRSLENMFNDLHRAMQKSQSALSQQLTILSATLLCLVFTSVCGIQHFQRAGHRHLNLFQSTYYVVVTFSTVGYGDFVPDIWPSQLFMVIMICVALIVLPTQFEQLAFTWMERQKLGGSYSSHRAQSEKHVVVCSTTLHADTIMDFLNEFYAHPLLQDYYVVLLSPMELDTTMRMILQVPIWAQRVIYIQGSCLKDGDLARARMAEAEACFILAARSYADKTAADEHAILRSWAVKDFAPNIPQYVQIFREGQQSAEEWHRLYGKCSGNEIYHIVLGDSRFFGEYEGKSFTYASFHSHRKYGVALVGVRPAELPEFYEDTILLNPGPRHIMKKDDTCYYMSITKEENSAFVVNQNQNQSPDQPPKEVTSNNNNNISNNNNHNINNNTIGGGPNVPPMAPVPSVCVRVPHSPSLNSANSDSPGSPRSYCKPTTLVIDSDITTLAVPATYTESLATSGGTNPAATALTSAITISDSKPNLKETAASVTLAAHTTTATATTTTTTTQSSLGPPAISSANHLEIPSGNNPNLLSPDILNQRRGSRRPSILPVPDMFTSSSFSISGEDGIDGEDNESDDEIDDDVPWRSPSEKIAAGSADLSLLQTVSLVLSSSGESKCCSSTSESKDSTHTPPAWHTDCSRYRNAKEYQWQNKTIILAADYASNGIYNFIIPLRAHFRSKTSLNPIILLLERRPDIAFLDAISYFPLVYWMLGSIDCLDDLLRAGITLAENVVVVNKELSNSAEEDTLADCNTIVAVQTMFKFFPSIRSITELSQSSNMRFMQFRAHDKYALHLSKMEKREKERGSHISYMFRLPFAAGNVFSASMLDTLLYQAFVKDYVITFVRLLLGIDQAPGSGFLTSMKITKDDMWIRTYGRLYQKLCSTTCEIPIGIYRTQDTSSADASHVSSSPVAEKWRPFGSFGIKHCVRLRPSVSPIKSLDKTS
ncbi:sodium-and chloride-activated ATP-sensitive potassium channel [Anopheles darlingi]|uniref:Sodium-and chloride-activated ATP-sensitive potassium channel n=1 Tax=Anopheles darlingi TaxID=43151 RepID=W5JWA3_ANODA|nr:sodium-and chloride-activated ATP-sensitive potassium channel [Anopheles darlingi]